MRIFARRERPHPAAKLSLSEHEDGYRYQLWVTNLPAGTRGWRGTTAYIDAGHRVHARVEDFIRTGKDTGISRFPSHDYGFNQAWLTAAMTAQALLAWLRLLVLDGDLARAEPSRKHSATAFSTQLPASCAADAADAGNSPPAGRGPRRLPGPGSVSPLYLTQPDLHEPVPHLRNPGACGTPGARPASRAAVMSGRSPGPAMPTAPEIP